MCDVNLGDVLCGGRRQLSEWTPNGGAAFSLLIVQTGGNRLTWLLAILSKIDHQTYLLSSEKIVHFLIGAHTADAARRMSRMRGKCSSLTTCSSQSLYKMIHI